MKREERKQDKQKGGIEIGDKVKRGEKARQKRGEKRGQETSDRLRRGEARKQEKQRRG